jgi:hypothetical protein
VFGHGKPMYRGAGAKTSTPCFQTSRASSPNLEFCYEMSMACAMMACHVLESSERGNSGHMVPRGACFMFSGRIQGFIPQMDTFSGSHSKAAHQKV